MEFGRLQQEIPSGEVARERAERADPDQPLGDRQGGPGALPQVLQAGVGLAGHEARDLTFADPFDGGEGEAHAPALVGLFDEVRRAGVTGRIGTPWRRASDTISRRLHIPGSCSRSPAYRNAGNRAFKKAL